jgi:hypothetical protein
MEPDVLQVAQSQHRLYEYRLPHCLNWWLHQQDRV